MKQLLRIALARAPVTWQLRQITLAGALGIALMASGCAATKPMLDQVKADISKLNAQLMTRLRGLEETGLEIKSEDNRVTIVVPDVFFSFGQSQLSMDARSAIAKAAELLSGDEYAEHDIRIEGYTDSVGSDDFNLKLSKKRAVAVEQELLFSAISEKRIDTVEGMGESNPIAPNALANGDDNPDGRAKNRRVEIVIIDSRLTAGN